MEPVGSILIYGEAKVGKTLDACFAFQNSLVLLAEPGGLNSVYVQFKCAGIPLPNTKESGLTAVTLKNLVNPMQEIIEILNNPGFMNGKRAVIIDTGTELADRIVAAVAASNPSNKFAPYQQVYSQISTLVRVLLVREIWLVMLCHEKPTFYDDSGKKQKGCALFPGSALPAKMPGMFSTIIRATMKEDGSRVYQCDPKDSDWKTGDRFHACLPEQDLDLRPILWRMIHPDRPVPTMKPKPIKAIE